MTALQRKPLQPLYAAAGAGDGHAGLMLQHGWANYVEGQEEGKSAHLKRICGTTVADAYRHCLLYTSRCV